MKTPEKLFSEFGAVTKDQWKAKAIEDLKGADFDKKLVWKTDEGFNVQPYYALEDLENQKALKIQHQLLTQPRRSWTNYVQISADDIAEANALATGLKKFNAQGFLFKLENGTDIDFKTLLKGLDPARDHISFSGPSASPAFIKNYFSFLNERHIGLDKIQGFYEADILDTFATKGTDLDFKALVEAIKETAEAPGFKALTIRSHSFVNAGSNISQELAFTLNKLVDYIDRLGENGIKSREAIGNIMLHIAIGGDYFFEIAKLRALRILLKSITGLYGEDAAAIKILSSGALWSKSIIDPDTNMLRNTTETMSAIIGGCDALLSLPHDANPKKHIKSSNRTALNISNILKEESYFDKTVDPAGGSYYLENLTKSIVDSTLELFRETEGLGGFIKAFKAGFIQEKIKQVRDIKEKGIATRRRVYVGVNKYPNLQEQVPIDLGKTTGHPGKMPLLSPQRAATPFVELRAKTQAHYEKTGFVPKVYLACFGNATMRKARATFSTEFFETAGFETLGEFLFEDSLKAAQDSAVSEADIVVMCASDQDYETQAVAFVHKFKPLAKDKILVLAGYPEKVVDDLKLAGVDAFIHLKSDAVEVLTDFQNKLLAKP